MKSETPGQTGGVSLGQSATCPHVRGRTTQWCALGQATAEAERALLRINTKTEGGNFLSAEGCRKIADFALQSARAARGEV